MLLGVAQDGGRPQVGCELPCCSDVADPGLPVALGLIDGEQRWMIDATPALPTQLSMLGGRLDGLLLTHAHLGHYTGLMYLGREALNTNGLPVYCMPRMRAFIEANGPWDQLVRFGNIELRELEADRDVELSPSLTVTPRLVPHRDEYSETVAFVGRGPTRSLLYLPDIDDWSRWSLQVALTEVDVALIDGTFWSDGELARDMSEIPHPRVVDTLARLSELPVGERRKVRFVHLNHSNPLWDLASAEAKAVAESGAGIGRRGDVLAL